MIAEKTFQDLSCFVMPSGFRGRNKVTVQLWWLVQASLFRRSPQFAYSWRAWILRLFGASVGIDTVIRPSAQITYPWKVRLGDRVWIGDDVVLYSLGDITVGADSVISQRGYLCAADHDYRQKSFPIRARPIKIGEECWIASDTFIGPGVHVGDGTVVGARSSVFGSLPAGQVCLGSPCIPIRRRESKSNEASNQNRVYI